MTPGAGLPGWERLRHGGLLLDGTRLEAVSRYGNVPAPLDACTERKLRQRTGAMLGGAGAESGESMSRWNKKAFRNFLCKNPRQSRICAMEDDTIRPCVVTGFRGDG